MTREILVLGAGVIGLTTAVCLVEAGHRVRVLAERLPAETTSAVASGLWGPGFSPRDLAWSRVGFTEFSTIAADPRSGVHFERGRLVSNLQAEPPPWVADLPEVRPCTPEELPDGMLVGMWTTVPLIDLPRYLAYLTRRLGVEIERRAVSSLDQAIAEVPVVVNCTGLGAAKLTGDGSLQPVRGQHVIVRNPGIENFYVEAVAETEWAGIFPHGDRVILGGVSEVGDWNLNPDPVVAEGILRRCGKIEPRLAAAEVIGHEVGLRPGRPAARLDVEERGEALVVHSYGHGGMGVSLSWGCAREVARILA